jgi:Zn-dependent peptidase ImmA (M78 family)/transcriptional regulator with XRE-family HTH domain
MSGTELYNLVFGPDSVGASEEERASSSSRIFVRSQLQIAEDNPRANGQRLTAYEAWESFGLKVLKKVAENGSCPIVRKVDEPSKTLRSRRSDLNLTIHRVARASGVNVDAVERAEKSGELSSFQVLQKIAQALALDERVLGFIPGARGDHSLGVRLREMAQATDAKKFSEAEVTGLSEAAWVIARYLNLAKTNGESESVTGKFTPSHDYAYPAYQKGYALATTTRNKLSIPPEEPIASLKSFIEDRLGVPVVQLKLGNNFAGATVANNDSRGIVINEEGANSNVWVRRMTLAHEIGHLLWDPDERLDKLRVDSYDELQKEAHGSFHPDVVEIRANAFAIAFLAPPTGVRKIMERSHSKINGVSEVMMHYGISGTAAKFHIKNVAGVDVSGISVGSLPEPSDEWKAMENLAVDFFKPKDTPISRRGKFALLVARAFKSGKITSETAGNYLHCVSSDFVENVDLIVSTLTSQKIT